MEALGRKEVQERRATKSTSRPPQTVQENVCWLRRFYDTRISASIVIFAVDPRPAVCDYVSRLQQGSRRCVRRRRAVVGCAETELSDYANTTLSIRNLFLGTFLLISAGLAVGEDRLRGICCKVAFVGQGVLRRDRRFPMRCVR